MSKKSKDSEILKLINFVRKHEVPKGDVIKPIIVEYDSITEWMDEVGLERGIHYVRGYIIFSHYKAWCQSKNKQKTETARAKKFHAALKQMFKYYTDAKGGNLTYYINLKWEKYDTSQNKKVDGQ